VFSRAVTKRLRETGHAPFLGHDACNWLGSDFRILLRAGNRRRIAAADCVSPPGYNRHLVILPAASRFFEEMGERASASAGHGGDRGERGAPHLTFTGPPPGLEADTIH
jgi:hypothetical protein